MRFAHISDFHFGRFSLNPTQFFSKRWIGNWNHFLFRRKTFVPERLFLLPKLFQELKVETILITGDLTQTASHREFAAAMELIQELKALKVPVLVLPGNHDHYTKSDYRNRIFYRFFPELEALKHDKVAVFDLDPHWRIILLDTVIPTPWFCCHGRFSEEIQERLFLLLSDIPKGKNVIVANHFPIFENDYARKDLERGTELRALLRSFPCIKLFLHGHTHRRTIADLRPSGYPILVDSGSATNKRYGSWSLFDLSPHSLEIHPYRWNEEYATKWEREKAKPYDLV